MPEIYSIGGGKGGVGKSFIVASLGTLLAKQGKKVVLVDLDLGASNLHTFFGIKNPKSGIDGFLNKTVTKLEDAAVPTAVPNLSIISSLHCPMGIANLYHAQKQKIISALRSLPFEYILLDLGAGTNFNTLDFFLTSKNGIIILTPEPTSIENSFRFMKAAYLRRLKHIIKQHAFNSAVKNTAVDPNNAAMKSHEIIKIVLEYDPEKEAFLKKKLSQLNFKFIINQFRKNLDSKLGEKIQTACNRHFYSNFQFLGNISYNEGVYDSILSQKLFVLKYPYTTSSIDLKKIVDQITKVRKSAALRSQLS
ncbi:MAG: nucleotide-binding protein [Candidatus Hodarchaeales archaeon]|jgi:flagellar biosynthesis protein FlhG